MKRILVVEDNRSLALGLRANLEVEGYDVHVAPDGPTGLTLATELSPDLLILDLMLPGMDGYDVLRSVRERGLAMPVMILSARGEEVDKVRGFRLGADDFVTKPFGLMELIARVEVMLRRGAAPTRAEAGVERFGEVEVDAGARTVRWRGEAVSLSPKAFDLLMALLRKNGRVASRLELMREVWGHRAAVESRTVDTHVAELRRKLEEDPSRPRHIMTAWKAGYRLER